jgi:hypothetical protein
VNALRFSSNLTLKPQWNELFLSGQHNSVGDGSLHVSSMVRGGYSATISSGDSPSARLSRITVTIMRMPWIQGLLWQMAGSMLILSVQ